MRRRRYAVTLITATAHDTRRWLRAMSAGSLIARMSPVCVVMPLMPLMLPRRCCDDAPLLITAHAAMPPMLLPCLVLLRAKSADVMLLAPRYAAARCCYAMPFVRAHSRRYDARRATRSGATLCLCSFMLSYAAEEDCRRRATAALPMAPPS